jgi:hypothetical protein
MLVLVVSSSQDDKSVVNLITQINLIVSYLFTGTFTPYNPITSPNELLGRAFSTGTYLDDTLAYVGTGNLTNCGSQTFLPGRATRSGNLQGPGVYVECNGEHHVTNSATYLEDHYDLMWVRADQNNASNVLFAIKIKGDVDSDGYFIGRVNLTSSNSTSYTQVGKVHIDNGKSNMWYANTDQLGQSADAAFEVLICRPQLSSKLVGMSSSYDEIAEGPLNFTQLLSLFSERMSGGGATDDDETVIAGMKSFDTNGQIDSEKLRTSLVRWGDKFTEDEVDDAFDQMVIDDKGFIDTAALITMLTGSEEEEE